MSDGGNNPRRRRTAAEKKCCLDRPGLRGLGGWVAELLYLQNPSEAYYHQGKGVEISQPELGEENSNSPQKWHFFALLQKTN